MTRGVSLTRCQVPSFIPSGPAHSQGRICARSCASGHCAFNNFFGRDQDLAELVFHASQLDALDQGAHHMLLVTRVSMHDVPTLSHGTPLANNQGDRPAEQGIETPQQQRHNQHDNHNNERGLSGSWRVGHTTYESRYELPSPAQRTTYPSQSARRQARNGSQSKKRKDAIQDWSCGVILITHNTNDYQYNNSQPLEQIKTRFLGFSFGSHRGGSCEKKPSHRGEWQVRRESNPQPTVLETVALPIELLTFPCGPRDG